MRGGGACAAACRAPAPQAVCRTEAAARSRGGKEADAATNVSRIAAGGGARLPTDRRRGAPRLQRGSLLEAVGRGAAAQAPPPRSGGGCTAAHIPLVDNRRVAPLGVYTVVGLQVDCTTIFVRSRKWQHSAYFAAVGIRRVAPP